MSCHVMRCGIMSGDVTTSCCCHEKCITNSAPATKSDALTSNSAHARTSYTPTSPNAAPATKSHITLCDTNHMKRHLEWRTSRP